MQRLSGTLTLTMDDIRAAAERLKNWGRWGADDEIGTLNFTHPEDIVAAARLVQNGKVISLALPYDHSGPQGGKTNYPALGRFNPIHLMMRTGTDAYSGVPTPQDPRRRRRHHDAPAMRHAVGRPRPHFLRRSDVERLRLPHRDRAGAQKCGIEKTKERWWAAAYCSTFRACSAWNDCRTVSRSPTKCSTDRKI